MARISRGRKHQEIKEWWSDHWTAVLLFPISIPMYLYYSFINRNDDSKKFYADKAKKKIEMRRESYIQKCNKKIFSEKKVRLHIAAMIENSFIRRPWQKELDLSVSEHSLGSCWTDDEIPSVSSVLLGGCASYNCLFSKKDKYLRQYYYHLISQGQIKYREELKKVAEIIKSYPFEDLDVRSLKKNDILKTMKEYENKGESKWDVPYCCYFENGSYPVIEATFGELEILIITMTKK